jgi:hypothetical protein
MGQLRMIGLATGGMMLRDTLPDVLQQYESDLASVVRDGLALFNTRFGTLRPGMTTRSERSNVHDCMGEMAKKQLPKFCRQRGNLFLIAIGQYRIKLKKLSPTLAASSYPTQAVFDFLKQKVQSLFEDGSLVNLHLGYVPDGMDLLKSTVYMTCPDGVRNLAWFYEMPAADASAIPAILPATVPDVPKAPRVRPKQHKLPKVGETGENR